MSTKIPGGLQQSPTEMNFGANTRDNIGSRRGIVGWWLNLTAPPVPKLLASVDARERLRKAELTSFSILAVFFFLLALVVNTLADAATAQAVVIMAVGLVIAAVCNRLGVGNMRFAAYFVPSLVFVVIVLAIVGARGGLDLVLIPAYDLFAIPIFISSLTGNQRIPWLFGFAAVAVILLDFFTAPHTLYTVQSQTIGNADAFDSIRYLLSRVGPVGAVNRHIALTIFAALFSWLGARSVDGAIRRADRAEEFAEYERRELESKRQIEVAAQHLLEVHTRVANGDFNSRVALDRGNVLWSVGQSLNNLLQRLQRQGQAEYQLRRTEEEAQRLAVALDEVNSGRYPLWPARANTVIDLLRERVAARGQQTGRSGHLPPQQRPQAPLPPPGFTSSGSGAQSSFPPAQPQMPSMGGFQEAWPPLSPAQPQPNQIDARPIQTSDNPWFLPPEGGNW